MLIEVGIMFSSYLGIRLYEKSRKKWQYIKKKKKKKSQSLKVKPIPKNNLDNPNIQDYRYYYNMGFIGMSLSAFRQFLFPQLALPSLAFFIYITIPVLRELETQIFKERKLDVNVLLFIAETITLAVSQYFAAAVGMFLLYRTKYTIAKAKGKSEKMLFKVFDKQPKTVWIRKNEIEIEIPFEKIELNDIVVVKTGEIIPIDGTIVKGLGTVDQQALTGEAQPKEKEVGDQVFASTMLITGSLDIKVEKSGKETNIAKIEHILNNSVNYKSELQLLGEKWANKGITPIFISAICIFPIFGPVATVVFINSHIAARIKIFASLGTLNHITLASHHNILIKQGQALERVIKIDTILFDKTGTLTHEEPEVGNIIACEQYQEDDILVYAAAAEHKFTHPIAKAILKKVEQEGLILPEIQEAEYQISYGIKVIINEDIVRVGSERFMLKENIRMSPIMQACQTESHQKGYSVIFVAIEDQVIGAIEIRPQLRPEVKQVVQTLRSQGIKYIAIVSGDHEKPTQKLANELGMDGYFYDVLPTDKAQIVEKLKQEGRSVCFIGDGINDAIAMQKACVSISLSGATSIAKDTADIILMDGRLTHLPILFQISKDLKENLHNALKIASVPTVLNLSGVFWLKFSILTSLILNATFTTAGIINAARPLRQITHEKRKIQKKKA
jgi:heavy metal translocating P-type ATPase